MLVNYATVWLLCVVCIMATIMDNFFFLVSSGTLNLLSMIVNVGMLPIRLSLVFLQTVCITFAFTYAFSVYLRMKLNIKKKRNQYRMRRFYSGPPAATL